VTLPAPTVDTAPHTTFNRVPGGRSGKHQADPAQASGHVAPPSAATSASYAANPVGTYTAGPVGTHAATQGGTHAATQGGTHAATQGGTHAATQGGAHAASPDGAPARNQSGNQSGAPAQPRTARHAAPGGTRGSVFSRAPMTPLTTPADQSPSAPEPSGSEPPSQAPASHTVAGQAPNGHTYARPHSGGWFAAASSVSSTNSTSSANHTSSDHTEDSGWGAAPWERPGPKGPMGSSRPGGG
jgi:hypothetical protein